MKYYTSKSEFRVSFPTLQQLGGDYNKTYQQPDAKGTQRFWTKIWQPKNITKRLNG